MSIHGAIILVLLSIVSVVCLIVFHRKEQHFRLLAESALDLVCLHAMDGTCLWVSPSCEDVLGFHPKEIVGHNLREFLHPEDLPSVVHADREGSVARGDTATAVVRARKKDGSHIWVEMRVQPVRDCRGSIRRVKTTCRDVTDRKQAENLYRFLVRNLPDVAVFLFDDHFRYVVAEGSILERFIASDLLGKVEGYNLYQALPPDVIESLESCYKAVFDGHSSTIEQPFRGYVYRIHTFPVFDTSGTISLGMSVVHDITEQRGVVTALRDRTADLERSNRDLEQFANVASHELKAPLRRIASFAELLAGEYQGRLSGEADEYIGHVIEGVGALKDVIDSLLVYSRVQTDRSEMETLNLNEVLVEAVKNLGPMIRDYGASVTQERLPSEVFGDRVLLRQLLENLIGNGIKFNNTGKQPRVHIKAKRGLLDWEVTVIDNGPGIAPEYEAKVFQMFQRLRPDVEGNGIGLALCKKIVGIHRGKIWLERLTEGAAFHFTLPARNPTEDITESIPKQTSRVVR